MSIDVGGREAGFPPVLVSWLPASNPAVFIGRRREELTQLGHEFYVPFLIEDKIAGLDLVQAGERWVIVRASTGN